MVGPAGPGPSGPSMSITFGGGWEQIPGGDTTATPDAVVSYGGKLYVFGIGIRDHAHYVNSFDGLRWSGWSAVPGGGTTLVADAAVSFNGRLYLFGIGINDHGHYVNSFDGSTWSGWSVVSGTTVAGPSFVSNVSDATAVYNGRLYLFGIGIGDHGHYVKTFDGVSWSGWSALPGGGTTMLSDTAVSFRGRLYVFGIGINDHAHYVNSFDGTTWSGWAAVPGGAQTIVPDAATAYAGKLYLFSVRASDGAHQFNAYDGTNWSGWTPVPGGGAVTVADAATVYKNNLYLVGVGEDERHYVQVASIHGPLPAYNKVTFQATHNSYWVKRDNVYELFASGTEERLLDQVLFEGARGWEIDLHHDNTTPHNFTVYHTDKESNSFCPQLGDCLQNLADLQHALPDHDPFTIVLELKETTPEDMFSADHTPADLDAILERYLGPWLFRPRDLLMACPGAQNLIQCVKAAGWPTIDQLRGRFLAVIIGNYDGEAPKVSTTCISPVLAHNNKAWVDYATGRGGAAARTAFPLLSPWMAPYIACQEGISQTLVDQVLNDSVFVQAEGGQGVMAQSWIQADLTANFVVRADYNGNSEASLAAQQELVSGGATLLQNDHPWFNVNGQSPLRVTIPQKEVSDLTALNEPGRRIMLKELKSGGSTHVPVSYSSARSARWETTVSVTRPATPPYSSSDPPSPNPMMPRGSGCLYASTASDANGNYQYGIRICRTTADGQYNVSKPLGEDAVIHVDVTQKGATTTSTHYSDDRGSAGLGEMLRLDLNQTPTQNACVTVYSGESMTGDVPNWHPVQTQCFPTTLAEEGLAAHDGDVLFVNTKHSWSSGSAAPAVATDSFDAPYTLNATYAVLDLSWPPEEPAQTCRPDVDGGCVIPVHRSYGEGHFYTTDIREASSWGFQVEVPDYFYLETSALSGRAPFYRCYNASVNRRFYTTARDCEGFGSVELVLGQIATSQLNGTVPLYRMYSAPDHFYTTDWNEVQSAKTAGYAYEQVAGYVWTGGR